MKFLTETVYPSDEKSVIFDDRDEEYGGAHHYRFKKCKDFNHGKTEYIPEYENLTFVRKLPTGNVFPGVQSEQIVIALIDRHKKLNAKFPSPQNAKMIKGLQMFLDACKERVDERMKAGVMGELRDIPKDVKEKPATLAEAFTKDEGKEPAAVKNKVETKIETDMPKGKGYPGGKKTSGKVSSSQRSRGSKTAGKATKPSRGKKSK